MSQLELTAAEIKKAILDKKKPPEPVEKASVMGIEGWLFLASSYQMEGWRAIKNALKDDGTPDEDRRRLAPAYLVRISFRDKKGEYVFDELDLPIIAGLPDEEIHPIRLAVMRINGMNQEGLEDILKNLIAIFGTAGVYDSLVKIGALCPSCTKDSASTNCVSSTHASDTGRRDRPQSSTEQSLPEKSQAKS